MAQNRKHIVLCNGASLPKGMKKGRNDKILEVTNANGESVFGTILLARLVNHVNHIPNRVKDLLELAGNIFIVDRKIGRGYPDSLEFEGWSRTIHFVMKVRDGAFWQQAETRKLLSEALIWMTGDYDYQFYFEDGYPSTTFNLFDQAGLPIQLDGTLEVALFSGGLDSFTGTIDFLEKNKDSKLLLVSHTSGNPSTRSTQERVYKIIEREYPNRTVWYTFKCHMTGSRAPEESQRTRSMLYSSVAYAVSNAFNADSFSFFENGITSLNFPKRADMINARSSRTTHPRTMWHLRRFFEHLHGKSFDVKHPYLLSTKTDVIARLNLYDKGNYINDTVSCSVGVKKEGKFTHCGTCSQCVDRRFAMHASQLDEEDGQGIYAKDFIRDKIDDEGSRLTIIDHVKQALEFKEVSQDRFYQTMGSELVNLLDYMNRDTESAFSDLFTLCKKHGQQIHSGIKRMREIYDDPFKPIAVGSFLDWINKKEFLKPEAIRLALKICKRIDDALPVMFRSNAPDNENDLNNKINGLIMGEAEEYGREFPAIQFASIKTVVDHSFASYQLLIETKYLRGSTGERVVSDGISADMIKYPAEAHLLFVLYDPDRKITNDSLFKTTFEKKRNNVTVHIVR